MRPGGRNSQTKIGIFPGKFDTFVRRLCNYDRIRIHRQDMRPFRGAPAQRVRGHRRRLRRAARGRRRRAALHGRPAQRRSTLPAPRHLGPRTGRQGAGRQSERHRRDGRTPRGHAALAGPPARCGRDVGRGVHGGLPCPVGALRRGTRGRRHDPLRAGHHDQRDGHRPGPPVVHQAPQCGTPGRRALHHGGARRLGDRACATCLPGGLDTPAPSSTATRARRWRRGSGSACVGRCTP